MNALRQIAAVSLMNLRSLPHRIGASSVVVIGIAGVVAVLVSVLAMSTGLVKTLQSAGPANRVIVVSTGSNSELLSSLTSEEILAVGDSAGIAKSADGRKLASPESLMTINLVKRDGDEASAPLRGISPEGFAVHPEIKISAGRSFRPGVAELIVGKSAERLYKGATVGSLIKLRGTAWTVVGTFDSGGGPHDSELIGDLRTLNSAYQRGNTSQSVLAIVEPGSAGFDAFKDSITTNPQLQVDVSREKDFGMQAIRSDHPDSVCCRLCGGRNHGGRGDLWRAQHHVLHRQFTYAGNCHPSSDRIRRDVRSGIGVCRGAAPGAGRRHLRWIARMVAVQRPFR